MANLLKNLVQEKGRIQKGSWSVEKPQDKRGRTTIAVAVTK